jgi:hypothetical protein
MESSKIYIPISIILGCTVLALSFYLVQVDKRKSIESQQEIQRIADQKDKDYKQEQQEIENSRVELKTEQDNCRSLSAGVRDKWGNVMGVTYSEIWRECVVTYTDTVTGEVKTSPLSRMKDVN